MDSSSDKRYQPNLCTKGCGFYGSASKKNLCSKCFREEQLIFTKAAVPERREEIEREKEEVPPAEAVRVYKPQDKCWTCKRRVKIAKGFKCRCGFLFCGSHRYPEDHHCSFDYKAMSEYEIAKANPMLKADKIQRI